MPETCSSGPWVMIRSAKRAGEDPEHDDAEPDHADRAVEELAVEAEAALERDREREDHDEADPDGQELLRHLADDAGAGAQQDAAHDVGQQDRDREQQGEAAGEGGVVGRAAGSGGDVRPRCRPC